MSSADVLLNALIDRLGDKAVIATDPAGLITHWGAGAERLLGFSPAQAIGQPVTQIIRRDDGKANTATALVGEAEASAAEQRFRSADGKIVYAAGHTQALRDAGGQVTGHLTVLHNSGIGHSESEFLRSVLAASDDCIKVLDLDGALTFMSEGGMRVMEVSDFNHIRGCAWPSVWTGTLSAVAAEAVEKAKKGERARFQGGADTLAGTPKYWDVQISPIIGIDGRPEKLLSVSRDMTELRQAEERRKVLTEELAHRIKNTLALVQALATQTFRSATTLEQARKTFMNRIMAIARSNDLLVQGEASSTNVGMLVANALDLFDQEQRTRISTSGPAVDVGPRAALAMSLIVHELSTNALKYGAMSNADGRVDISWTTGIVGGEQRFSLTWSESGGPPVTAPPDRKGFGSRLIGESLPTTLGGTMTKDWRSEGLVARLDAPLAAIAI